MVLAYLEIIIIAGKRAVHEVQRYSHKGSSQPRRAFLISKPTTQKI